MASNSSGLQIEADRNRWGQWSITIGESDGDNSLLAPSDKVRVRIGRTGQTPLLEIVSGAPTTAGSNTTAANPTVLTIEGQTDLTFPAAIYDVEVDVVDSSDRPKKAERGVFILKESL